MGRDKLWIDVAGAPLVALTLARAADAACFDAAVIAAPRERWDDMRRLSDEAGLTRVEMVEGGARRQESVRAALAASASFEYVCVHDAARPLASAQLFSAVVSTAISEGAATAAIPCVDTIKRVSDEYVLETLPRDALIATQTPQAFARELLARAHDEAAAAEVQADDDAYLVERLGHRVAVVPGEVRNFKVTHAHDVTLLRALLDDRA